MFGCFECKEAKFRVTLQQQVEIQQRFSEIPDQLEMAILSVTPGNPLQCTLLM